MDAYSLVLLLEGGVILASGLGLVVLAARNTGAMLYARAVGIVGSGLVVGGLAAGLLAVDATQPVPSVVVALAAVPFGVAGWCIATDTVAADHADVYVGGADTSTTTGFGGEP